MIDLILLQPIPEQRLSLFSMHLFRRSTVHLKVEVSSGLPFGDTLMELIVSDHGIEHYQLQSMASGLSCPHYSLCGQLLVFQHRVLTVIGLDREEVAGGR
jgi:hypothetical protein